MNDDSGFSHSILSGFSVIPSMQKTWQKVLCEGRRIERPKGYELLSSGKIWDTLYYLEEGEVHLVRTLADGRERLLWMSTPPSFIGEGPFFDQLPASSSFIVTKPSVLYAFSPAWIFNTLLPKYPELTFTLLQSMAHKLRVVHNQSVYLSMEDLPSRICKFLYSKLNTDKINSTHAVISGLSQQELANLFGVHRVTLNKSLRALVKQGVLGSYSKKEICILDMVEFMRLVDAN